MVLLRPQARRCTSISRLRDGQLPNTMACQSNLLGKDARQESKTRAGSSSWWAGESLALMGLIPSCAVLTAYNAKECVPVPSQASQITMAVIHSLSRLTQHHLLATEGQNLAFINFKRRNHLFHIFGLFTLFRWDTHSARQDSFLFSHPKSTKWFYRIWFYSCSLLLAFPVTSGHLQQCDRENKNQLKEYEISTLW